MNGLNLEQALSDQTAIPIAAGCTVHVTTNPSTGLAERDSILGHERGRGIGGYQSQGKSCLHGRLGRRAKRDGHGS